MSSVPDAVSIAAPRVPARATVDFFAAEDRASARAWRYFALFVPCTVAMVVAICAWVGFVLLVWGWFPEITARMGGQPIWQRLLAVPPQVYGVTAIIVMAVIGGTCVRRIWQMKQGG